MEITDEKLIELKEKANNIRISLIEALVIAGSGHTAGPLDMADIFAVLFFHTLSTTLKNPSGRNGTDWYSPMVIFVQYSIRLWLMLGISPSKNSRPCAGSAHACRDTLIETFCQCLRVVLAPSVPGFLKRLVWRSPIRLTMV